VEATFLAILIGAFVAIVVLSAYVVVRLTADRD
jgi:hypothetical protein